METTFGSFGTNLFQSIEQIHQIWFSEFGDKFQDSWKEPENAIEQVIKLARENLAKNKGLGTISDCHLTLFLRDPITDRLVLSYSTNDKLNTGNNGIPANYFSDAGKEANFDRNTKRCYYKLHDRLSLSDADKCSEMVCKERGLTGWVAVTGIPLIINNSNYTNYSASNFLEDTLISDQCITYGKPLWGCRISEFPQRNRNNWSLRYMAVPIKSLINSNETIGVLRFVARLSIPELTQVDLLFLEEIANVITALKNIGGVKIIVNRDEELEKEKMIFESRGDFSRFLEFVSRNLRSYIASLYISLKKDNGGLILRLFDAYGIANKTGELRSLEEIQDYDHNNNGLTYRLLSENEIKVYDSVVRADGWTGLNTKLFYRNALANLGMGVDDSNLKDVIGRYRIKLMGCRLKQNPQENPVGVLKVEFPVTFDDSKHYNNDDQNFFEKCAEILMEEIANYKHFIEENMPDQRVDVKDFVRYLVHIQRYKLLEPQEDFSRFWSNVKEFAINNEQAIKAATYDMAGNSDISALNLAWEKPQGIINERLLWLVVEKALDVLAQLFINKIN